MITTMMDVNTGVISLSIRGKRIVFERKEAQQIVDFLSHLLKDGDEVQKPQITVCKEYGIYKKA